MSPRADLYVLFSCCCSDANIGFWRFVSWVNHQFDKSIYLQRVRLVVFTAFLRLLLGVLLAFMALSRLYFEQTYQMRLCLLVFSRQVSHTMLRTAPCIGCGCSETNSSRPRLPHFSRSVLIIIVISVPTPIPTSYAALHGGQCCDSRAPPTYFLLAGKGDVSVHPQPRGTHPVLHHALICFMVSACSRQPASNVHPGRGSSYIKCPPR